MGHIDENQLHELNRSVAPQVYRVTYRLDADERSPSEAVRYSLQGLKYRVLWQSVYWYSQITIVICECIGLVVGF